MITRKQYRSAKDTVHYFDNSLAQSDYHTQDGQIIGSWNGSAANKLNLSKEVNREDFDRIIHNVNPQTGDRLTSRTTKNRTVAEDWTFSVPKSVSIQYAITEDKDIINAVNKANLDTMSEVEKDAQTRVRVDGKYENRKTGNLVWASFLHDDTRPVEQEINGQKVHIPDPQIHVHNVIANATYDEKEEKWKAVQFRNMVATIPYYRELFGSKLANNLKGAGYQLERTSNNFEIAGYDRSTIEKFSNRTKMIDEIAAEKGITDPDAKAALGAKTRSNKRKGIDKEALRQFRLSQLDEKELAIIKGAKGAAKDAGEKKKDNEAARLAVDYAIEHGLARKSVIDHKELLRHALNRGKVSTTKEQIEFAISSHEYLRSKETEDGRIYTNVEAHVEEKKLIAEARNGRDKYKAINPDYKLKNPQLTKEQKEAVKHALNSRDFITMITGRAGTGKTWSVKEIAQGTKEAGLNFEAFAPGTEASRRSQREEGFEKATTIAELLVNEKRHEQIKGGVIWVDEAGMVGNATMNRVINLAKKQNARILLTGDSRQHNSVERGDAMRIIEKYAQIKSATISKNQRQKNDQYREAVEALSKGQMENGYKTLDKMGAIKESEDMEALKENVANEYVASVKSRDKIIIVAITHSQGLAVTEKIRKKLKEEGRLAVEDKPFISLRNLNLDEAQKKDRVNYKNGNVIEFHQNVRGGFSRGTRHLVSGVDKDGNVLVSKEGKEGKNKNEVILPMQAVEHFSVFEKMQLPISTGDQVRITKSGFTNDKHRMENGDMLSVKGFSEDGNIKAFTGRKTVILNKDFGHLTHGYTVTSQKSQGKTVNKVIIMQGSVSGKASSMEQFYVSASRGKFSVSVHTDDKELLLHNIKRSSKRMMAMEVAGEKKKEMDLAKEFNKAKSTPPQTASTLNKDWQQTQATPTPDPDPPIEPEPPPRPSPGIEPDSPSL